MKVKMKTCMAGPNGTVHVGHVTDVDEAKAKILVEGGFAEFVSEPKPVAELETTAVKPAEVAARPTRGRPRTTDYGPIGGPYNGSEADRSPDG